MAVQFTPYTPIVVFSATVLAAVAWVGWRRRDHPALLPLTLVAAGGGLYATGYALELTTTSLALKRLTWRVQIVGWYVLLPSLFVFAVRYADDGSGIDPGIRERLFEQGAMGERSSGIGLGLYLVRSLVTDFGGEVDVRENEPGGRSSRSGSRWSSPDGYSSESATMFFWISEVPS